MLIPSCKNNKIFDFNSSNFFRKAGKAYISIMNDFVLLLNDSDKSLNKIGIIFNTDPHNKSGSHWISLFIDVKKKIICFFDSVGI